MSLTDNSIGPLVQEYYNCQGSHYPGVQGMEHSPNKQVVLWLHPRTLCKIRWLKIHFEEVFYSFKMFKGKFISLVYHSTQLTLSHWCDLELKRIGQNVFPDELMMNHTRTGAHRQAKTCTPLWRVKTSDPEPDPITIVVYIRSYERVHTSAVWNGFSQKLIICYLPVCVLAVVECS